MKYVPQPLSYMDVVFPESVSHLMPKFEDIPKEFAMFNGKTKWNKLFNDMFYLGVKIKKLVPQDGVDASLAWKNIRAISGSFEPKHEHKEAACAYLMSLWFKDIEYEPLRKR